MSLARLDNVSLVDSDAALKQADIVAFLVGHRPFRRLERKLLLDKVIVDAVGLIS